MQDYFTFTSLLGLRDENGGNLPLFKEARVKRYQSVIKMSELIETALATRPILPPTILTLDPTDPEWDDKMPFPVMNFKSFLEYGLSIAGLMVHISLMKWFYSYNYNAFTSNVRFRVFRNVVPLFIGYCFYEAYAKYRTDVLKINLFDEYCWLRSQELVKQNEYLLEHEDVKKYVWWNEDMKQTFAKIYRQGNDHAQSDFKDSELLLQDFINRYVDPNSDSPMKNHARIVL